VSKAIHILPNGERDWVVREVGGHATRAEAEAVGNKLARKRRVELVVQEASGKLRRSRPRKGWFARVFGN
jgi:Uncharacterized protein conserved in bacteria (DUF2188)